MVSNRCKAAVKEVLINLGLHFVIVDLGEVEIMETINEQQRQNLRKGLILAGLDLMDNKKAILIEKIKTSIIDMVHHSDENVKINFSAFLTEKLPYDYTYLSNLFSEVQGTTIEHFIIAHKIEKVKELIVYDELNLTQISYKLGYSSVAHLSTQFKKVTGLTPSHFKKLKQQKRLAIEDVN